MEPGRDSHLLFFYLFCHYSSDLWFFIHAPPPRTTTNDSVVVLLVITYFQIQVRTIIYRLYVVPLHSNNNQKRTITKHTYWQIIPFLWKQGETTQIQRADINLWPSGTALMGGLHTGSESRKFLSWNEEGQSSSVCSGRHTALFFSFTSHIWS